MALTREAPPEPASAAIAATADRRARPGWCVGLLLLLLAGVLFLGYGSRTVAAPFGDSHDGRNAGVWAAGSRSLREEGPLVSRLGTRSPENGVYANHPPLIYVETAVAELVGGRSTAATRAPAWLGSLLVIVLLARLLRDRGLRASAIGMAVLLSATTPMFLVYGTMLDTPVTSLPFGIGLLVLWERARHGDHVRPWCVAVLAAIAVLAGWQALLLSFAIGAWALGRLLRHTGRREVDLAFAGGALAGGVLLLAWLLWAFGGTLRPLLDQFLYRTGQSGQPVGLGAVLAAQRRDSMAMFGVVGIIAAAGLVVAWRDRRTRGLVAVALAVTLPYPFVFGSGAVNHNYWGYWFLLPVALGLAAGFEVLLRHWRGRGCRESVVALSVAGLGILLTMTAWAVPRAAESMKLSGFRVAEATDRAALAPGQREAWYAGAVGAPASWLALATRRPAVVVPESGYDVLAGSRPADLVLVGEVRCKGGRDDRRYELRPAGSLVDRPPTIAVCGSTAPTQPGGGTGR